VIEYIEVIDIIVIQYIRLFFLIVGQRKDVHIYRLMIKNTIEERISNLQERKLKLAGDVLAGCIDKFSLKLEDIAFLCS
jgi:SNF2 family DNA or RNA helicase